MPCVQCVPVCALLIGMSRVYCPLFFDLMGNELGSCSVEVSFLAHSSPKMHRTVCPQRSTAVISAKCSPLYLVCFKMDIRPAIWKFIKSRCNAQDDCGISRCALQNHHTFNAISGVCYYSSSTCRSTVKKQPVPVLTLTKIFLKENS